MAVVVRAISTNCSPYLQLGSRLYCYTDPKPEDDAGKPSVRVQLRAVVLTNQANMQYYNPPCPPVGQDIQVQETFDSLNRANVDQASKSAAPNVSYEIRTLLRAELAQLPNPKLTPTPKSTSCTYTSTDTLLHIFCSPKKNIRSKATQAS